MSPKSEIFDGVIKHSIKSVFDGINEKTENYRKSFDLLRRFRGRHSSKLVSSLSKVQILAMRGAIPLIELYVPTRFSKRLRRDVFLEDIDDILDLDLLKQQQANEVDLLGSLVPGENILIQGGPGSGKTTFVSAYVMGLIDECKIVRDRLSCELLPLHFVLRDSPEPPENLQTLIKQYLRALEEEDAYPFIERMMISGSVCIIFDGLDEIPVENQELWRRAIERLKKIFSKLLVVVTCRSGSLAVDFIDFKHFEILPFTRNDSRQFIDSWFGEAKEETAASLHKDLRDHPRINDLTETPLLLSLLCNLYENDLELSSNRTDLYSRCIEVLMIRWDTSRGFKRTTHFQDLSLAKRRRLFALVGYHLSESRYMILSDFSAGKLVGEYIERYDIEQENASDVLSELESHHGLLVKPGANCWCFSHKSLQDFFAAEYVKNCSSHIEFLKRNWNDQSKWEVLTFASTLLEDGDEFAECLMELAAPVALKSFPALGKRIRGGTLLIKCLKQGMPVSKKCRTKIFEFLIHMVDKTAIALAATHVFPYGFQVDGKLMISYYYYKGKQRKSTNTVYRPLSILVQEMSRMKGRGLDDLIIQFAAKAESISTKLLLASSMFERNTEEMLKVYEKVGSSKNSFIYHLKLREVAENLRKYIDDGEG